MLKSLALLLALAVASLPALAQNNATSTFQTGHSGFWADASGSGIALTVDEGRLIGAAVYTFSPTTVPVLLPGLQAGDPIEGANHVYLVGGAAPAIGQHRVVIPLFMPIFGDGFMGPAEDVVPFGELTLSVATCERIDYEVRIWTGLPTAEPGVVQSRRAGTLRRITRAGGQCALDCQYPGFGPLPSQCPVRKLAL